MNSSYSPSPLDTLRATFRALRHRNFALFFAGQGVSLIGTWMQQIAMSWLVYRMTHSAFLLGLVSFSGQFPTFLFASFAGVYADHWNRHRILIITQTLAMIQALILALLTMTGMIQVWQIVVLGLMLGTIAAFDIPARQAFMMDMIEDREDIGNAIALNSSLVNSARLLGPSLAGILVAFMGEGICFLINGISFLAVLIALFFMKMKKPFERGKVTDVWTGWKEGIKYAIGFRPIGSILALLSVASLTASSYVVLMPIFVTTKFHGGPQTLGFLMAASGLGALAGTLYLASRKSVLGLGRFIFIGAVILGSAMMLFSISSHLGLSILFLFVGGFGMIVEMASSNTILQTIVDDDKRGRIMSLYAMAFMGMAPIGSFVSGSLASRIGATSTVFVSGIICLIGAILFARQLPGIRQLVRPIYEKKGIISQTPDV